MHLKVKDFASLMGVSESIVYRHIRKHREELGDLVIKKAKATWLTDEGQAFVRELMVQEPPAAVTDVQTLAELNEVRAENAQLTKELREASATIRGLVQTNQMLQEENCRLLTSEAQKQLLEANIEKQAQELAEARNEAMEAIVAADNAEKARVEADNRAVTCRKNEIEAVTRAERAEAEAAELRRQIDALKQRGPLARLFRKGE